MEDARYGEHVSVAVMRRRIRWLALGLILIVVGMLHAGGAVTAIGWALVLAVVGAVAVAAARVRARPRR